MAGKIMVVEEATGKVLEIKDAAAEETESEEEAEADKQAAEMIIGEIKANRKKMDALEAENTKLHKKVEELATQIVEGKVDKSKFAYNEDPERKKRGQKYI
jgi:predicted RNase H-like nuclease (RuvC/YqgF family)